MILLHRLEYIFESLKFLPMQKHVFLVWEIGFVFSSILARSLSLSHYTFFLMKEESSFSMRWLFAHVLCRLLLVLFQIWTFANGKYEIQADVPRLFPGRNEPNSLPLFFTMKNRGTLWSATASRNHFSWQFEYSNIDELNRVYLAQVAIERYVADTHTHAMHTNKTLINNNETPLPKRFSHER